ncbi:GreA/GreB family elongation factor [Nonlabens ponticola]|uniref:Transcription elongation factor GreA n=1 Tax=Nonlabens ponticola TaxID=2496866 RepID=A0A3S9MW98_9FLAO|nr:GreA/GreB family elongation factor [Nonlabens ponticola]AZQ43409.1 transcription elongation factor GreA [Nonlabens ponticola]
MSRGFVKEGDQEEPVVIPKRAILPDGTINYVTQRGYELLQEELGALENELGTIDHENETDRRRANTLIHGKIKLLKERIASARKLNVNAEKKNEVRFGAVVTFKNLTNNSTQMVSIVGVDEADVAQGKISFTTPIAKALTGSQVGEVIDFKLGSEVRKLKILNIDY